VTVLGGRGVCDTQPPGGFSQHQCDAIPGRIQQGQPNNRCRHRHTSGALSCWSRDRWSA
jgi:hypothetical protein